MNLPDFQWQFSLEERTGAAAVEMNKLIGFGPVTADNSYVTGVDGSGNFVRDRKMTWSDYQLNMLKIQKLVADI